MSAGLDCSTDADGPQPDDIGARLATSMSGSSAAVLTKYNDGFIKADVGRPRSALLHGPIDTYDFARGTERSKGTALPGEVCGGG